MKYFPSLRSLFIKAKNLKENDADTEKHRQEEERLKEELKQRDEALRQAEIQNAEEARKRAEFEKQLEAERLEKERRQAEESKTASKNGKTNGESEYALAKKYYTISHYEQAVYWYRKAAEHGYAKAQYWLGYMYYWGHGVEQNQSGAFRLWSIAAEGCIEEAYRDDAEA